MRTFLLQNMPFWHFHFLVITLLHLTVFYEQVLQIPQLFPALSFDKLNNAHATTEAPFADEPIPLRQNRLADLGAT